MGTGSRAHYFAIIHLKHRRFGDANGCRKLSVSLCVFFFSGAYYRFFVCSVKFNPLSPNSDQHLISPHNITDSSNIHETRMNEMITKDGMS